MILPSDWGIFSDPQLTKEIRLVDFGEPFVGTVNEKVVYIANLSQWPITDIQLTNKSEEVSISYPDALNVREVLPVKITWKPSLARREPLELDRLFTGRLRIGGIIG